MLRLGSRVRVVASQRERRQFPRALRAAAACLLVAFPPGSPGAEEAPAERPVVDVPRLPGPPSLESFLYMRPEGEVASRMARVEGLVQQIPRDGEPASQATHIYLGYDDEHLYAVFVAFDDEPERIRANFSRREDIFGDDIVEIMLDTFRDRRRAYAFVTNPHGVQWDAIWTEGAGFDGSYDTVWRSRGRLTDRGYVVWMAIPFRSLRFPATDSQTWGLIFVRDIRRNNESSFWPRVSSRIEGRLNQAATLRGLERISPGRNIQLIPFGSARSFRVLDRVGPDAPRFVEDRADADAGLDAKLVFKDALVLDLTANPDFSEVESDSPQVTVNQRFEVFFPEKRPFFLENASFFQTPVNLLFTRRIVEPRAGARLTGKLGPWAVGSLIIDDESPPEARAADSPVRGENAYFGILRVSRDVGGQSNVGFMFTDRELADGYSRVAGVDGRLKLNANWTTRFQALASRSRLLDETDEWKDLSGPAYDLVAERDARGFTTHMHYLDFSSGFRTLTGFVPRTDIREVHQSLRYRFWPEGRHLVNWGPELFWRHVRDHDGTRLDREINPSFSWEFRRQTEIDVFYAEGRERLRAEDLRDPSLLQPGESLDFETGFRGVEFSTHPFNAFQAEVAFAGATQIHLVPVEGELPTRADQTIAEIELTLRPTRRLAVRNEYLFTRLSDPRDGRRIFRNQIARSRWSYQFTPRLNLRAIVQYDATRGDPEKTGVETGRNVNGDLLVSYLVNPWTALFVGYTGNWRSEMLVEDAAGGPAVVPIGSSLQNDARQVFVKFSYLFRP